MRLCLDNDLVPPIDRCRASVTLNHTFARRHLRALVIRAIALPQRAFGAAPLIRMPLEPVANVRRILLQAFHAPACLLVQ